MSIINQPGSVAGIMFKVLIALVPAIAAYAWYFGPAVLVQIALASVTALASEAAMLRLRRRPVRPFLLDGSATVTAWLLALSLPPLGPWWLTVVATVFAIVIAKQLYGGLGNNLFNPAMAGYAAAIISFPAQMTQWSAPATLAAAHLHLWQQLQYIFGGGLPAGVTIDALTMATPLDTLKTQLQLQQTVGEIIQMPIFGPAGNEGGEIIALGYLAGGLYLWQRRIIGWHIPIAYMAALFVTAGAFHAADSDRYIGPLFHLVAGATLIGAFFILTDPVTGPTTPKGKLIYAAGAGFLTYIIRVFGGYPDGVAFSVLLMNICVPLIDAYTQPPVFGKKAVRQDGAENP